MNINKNKSDNGIDEIRSRFSYFDIDGKGSISDQLNEISKKVEPPPKHPGPDASRKEKVAYDTAVITHKKNSLKNFVKEFEKSSKKPKPKKVIIFLTELMGSTIDDNDLLSEF